MLDIRQLKVENRQTLIQLGFDPISLLTKPVYGPQVYGTQFRPDVSIINVIYNLILDSNLIVFILFHCLNHNKC